MNKAGDNPAFTEEHALAFAGQDVHSIGAGTLIIWLSKSIAAKVVEPLALGIAACHKDQPYRHPATTRLGESLQPITQNHYEY